VKTARQHLMRLVVDAASWTLTDGIGPTHSVESRRDHAELFIRNALLPDAGDDLREIARRVALPILQERGGPGRPSDARRDQILVETVALVCKTHNLHPTRRSGQAESGCSVTAMAVPKFLDWLRAYLDEQLRKTKARDLRNFLAELPKLAEKLFPEGVLSEQTINNIWDKRPRS
jgi:hypothetical protein